MSYPTPNPWTYDDGGRAAAGYRGTTGDCVTRAIAIVLADALPTPPYPGDVYRTVYDDLAAEAAALRETTRPSSKLGRTLARNTSPRNGVAPAVIRSYLAAKGWEWTPTMAIGAGTTIHLRPGELPDGRLIVRLSGHLAAVIDGVVHDIADPSRGGTRCVYGYWRQD